jgi:hypothetical protein
MHVLFAFHAKSSGRYMTAEDAEFAYNNINQNSRLKEYVKEFLMHDSSFSSYALQIEARRGSYQSFKRSGLH